MASTGRISTSRIRWGTSSLPPRSPRTSRTNAARSSPRHMRSCKPGARRRSYVNGGRVDRPQPRSYDRRTHTAALRAVRQAHSSLAASVRGGVHALDVEWWGGRISPPAPVPLDYFSSRTPLKGVLLEVFTSMKRPSGPRLTQLPLGVLSPGGAFFATGTPPCFVPPSTTSPGQSGLTTADK